MSTSSALPTAPKFEHTSKIYVFPNFGEDVAPGLALALAMDFLLSLSLKFENTSQIYLLPNFGGGVAAGLALALAMDFLLSLFPQV